jgi:hypothetical protein
MSAYDELAEGIGEAFTGINAEFAPGVTEIYFQAQNDDDELVTIFTLTGNWLFEKSKRQATVYTDAGRSDNYMLQVADALAIRSDMLTAMTTGFEQTGELPATHVSIGGTVCKINRPDVVKPSFLDPLWQIPCDHQFI